MEKVDGETNQERRGKRSHKSKNRMSYLKRRRDGGGGGWNRGNAKVDEHGQMYGDYVPAYGSNSARGQRGGRRGSRHVLQFGMKGFICTTNFKERECVREAYNILGEYCEEDKTDSSSAETKAMEQEGAAAQSSGESSHDTDKTGNEADDEGSDQAAGKPDEDSGNDDDDIDQALSKELQDLKSDKTVKKFQNVDTGVTNVVFISTTIDDPTKLAYRIFDDVSSTKVSKSRHLLRLLPIELTCYANNLNEIKEKSREVLEKYLKTGYNSFKIVANIRLNTSCKRDDLIKTLADVVSQINPLNFVDLTNAKYTVVAEVLKTTLCLGVVENFAAFKKYNLVEVATPDLPKDEVELSGKPQSASVDEPSSDVQPEIK